MHSRVEEAQPGVGLHLPEIFSHAVDVGGVHADILLHSGKAAPPANADTERPLTAASPTT